MAKKKRKPSRQHQIRLYRGWMEDYCTNMSPNSYMVYSWIAVHCDWQTGKGCPTFKTISIRSGLSEGIIRRAVRELETIGVIKTEFRKALNSEGKEYGRKRYFYQLTHIPTKQYFRSDNRWRKGRNNTYHP